MNIGPIKSEVRESWEDLCMDSMDLGIEPPEQMGWEEEQ